MISVIIPTADRPGPLHRALRSLARQTFTDVEVIVVRDGGRPVRAVIDSWHNDLDITLLEVQPQQGVSHARNVGLTAAAGEYVAFLDDDDIYLPQHLHAAHTALTRGEADLVYGGAVVCSRWVEALPRSAATLPRKDYPFHDRFLSVANFIHTGSVVTRNFAATPVRFDEQMTHCEDWDLWLALRRTLGYRFAFLGACTTVYHQVPRHDSAVSRGYQTTPTPFTRARAHLYAKWPAADPLVTGYRDWFGRFDHRLDACIATGSLIPAHIYEHAIRMLHPHFTTGAPADPAWLDRLFPTAPPHQASGQERLPAGGGPNEQTAGATHASR